MSNNIVLAAVDLQHEESDIHITEEALAIARSHNAELHLAFVIPDEKYGYVQAYIPADLKAKVEQSATMDAKTDLEKFRESIDVGDTRIETHVLRGIIYEEIVDLSNSIKADTIVIGAHKPGFMDLFLGPNSARVARRAKCNVMIIRPTREK